MPNSTFNLSDLSQLKKAARWFLEHADSHKIIAFNGDLGAGKTTFIQELCLQLGVVQAVTSPTFAIVNEYTASNNQIIYHFDFYRFLEPEEALDIGFEDYIYSGNWCFIEWPEKVGPFLPPDTLHVNIDVQAEGSRLISLRYPA